MISASYSRYDTVPSLVSVTTTRRLGTSIPPTSARTNSTPFADESEPSPPPLPVRVRSTSLGSGSPPNPPKPPPAVPSSKLLNVGATSSTVASSTVSS